jgi:hypothetical protein
MNNHQRFPHHRLFPPSMDLLLSETDFLSQRISEKESVICSPRTPVKSNSSNLRSKTTPIFDRSQFAHNRSSEVTPIKLHESIPSSLSSLTKRKYSSVVEQAETARCCLFEDDSDIEYESEYLSDSDVEDKEENVRDPNKDRIVINLVDDETEGTHSSEQGIKQNSTDSRTDKDEEHNASSEDFTTRNNSFHTEYHEDSQGMISMHPLPAMEDTCSSIHTFTTMSSITMSSFSSGSYMNYLSKCEKLITEDSTQFLSIS